MFENDAQFKDTGSVLTMTTGHDINLTIGAYSNLLLPIVKERNQPSKNRAGNKPCPGRVFFDTPKQTLLAKRSPFFIACAMTKEGSKEIPHN